MELPLRQRKRIRTMVHIQAVAMRLFEEKGYRAVTIEQIAHEAEVAPATVYRYFETKTGFFTVDPVEQPGYDEEVFVRNLLENPTEAVRSLFAQILNEEDEATNFIGGMQFVLEIPEVRSAVILKNVQLADEVASQLVSQSGMSDIGAKSFSRSVLIRIFTAMEQWHIDGRKTPFDDYLVQACEGLRAPVIGE